MTLAPNATSKDSILRHSKDDGMGVPNTAAKVFRWVLFMESDASIMC